MGTPTANHRQRRGSQQGSGAGGTLQGHIGSAGHSDDAPNSDYFHRSNHAHHGISGGGNSSRSGGGGQQHHQHNSGDDHGHHCQHNSTHVGGGGGRTTNQHSGVAAASSSRGGYFDDDWLDDDDVLGSPGGGMQHHLHYDDDEGILPAVPPSLRPPVIRLEVVYHIFAVLGVYLGIVKNSVLGAISFVVAFAGRQICKAQRLIFPGINLGYQLCRLWRLWVDLHMQAFATSWKNWTMMFNFIFMYLFPTIDEELNTFLAPWCGAWCGALVWNAFIVHILFLYSYSSNTVTHAQAVFQFGIPCGLVVLFESTSEHEVGFPHCLNGAERISISYMLCALKTLHFFQPRFMFSFSFMLPLSTRFGDSYICHYLVLLGALLQMRNPGDDNETPDGIIVWPPMSEMEEWRIPRGAR